MTTPQIGKIYILILLIAFCLIGAGCKTEIQQNICPQQKECPICSEALESLKGWEIDQRAIQSYTSQRMIGGEKVDDFMEITLKKCQTPASGICQTRTIKGTDWYEILKELNKIP